MQILPFSINDTAQAAQDGSQFIDSQAAKARSGFDSFMDKHMNGLRQFSRAARSTSDAVEAQQMWKEGKSGLKALREGLADAHTNASKNLDNAARALSSKLDTRLVASKATKGGTATKTTGSSGLGALSDRLSKLLSGEGGKEPTLRAMNSLKMTMEDFASLKEGLKDYGLSDEEIEALSERIASEGGLSWGQFMASLSSHMEAKAKGAKILELDPEEKSRLQRLFTKMGVSAQDSKVLVSKLESGKSSSVWAELNKTLNTLPEDAVIKADAAELGTLGRALGLSEQGLKRLASMLGGAEKVSLTVKGLKSVMAEIQSEVTADAKAGTDATQNLSKIVDNALAKAAERMDLASLAGSKADNSARNMKILGEESRRERARTAAEKRSGEAGSVHSDSDGEEGTAERILSADPRYAAVKADAKTGKTGKNSDETAAAAKGKDAKAGGETRTDGEAVQAGKTDSKNADGKSQTGDGASEDSEKKAAWKELWGKVRREGGANSSAAEVKGAAKEAAAMAEAMRESQADSVTSRLGKNVTARVLHQVQNGVLKNVAPGKTQLILEIDPPELGKLHMVLQVKDGEVSAMFRAETQDASRLMSEQLAQLKTHLENQGLKVGKMEVQTQLQNDQQNQNWQGSQRHNLSQEQENLESRQRIWRMLRNSEDGMAQEMQNGQGTVKNSHEGLYVIA